MSGSHPPARPYFAGLDVAGCRVVVVGVEGTASQRLPELVAAGADVLVVSVTVSPFVRSFIDGGQVAWRARPYQSDDLDDAWLVVLGADASPGPQVAADAADRRIFCVAEDDRGSPRSHAASRTRLGDLQVAVVAPDRLRASRILGAVVDAGDAGMVCRAEPRPPSPGVVLVGGGLGDPNLLTIRARRLVTAADVVVVDDLRCRDLVRGLRPEVDVVVAGAERVRDLLVERARGGDLVVRMTSGDPFLEGHGYEEMRACEHAGVPVTVVPGVAAVFAAPALGSVPVSHRGGCQEIVVVGVEAARHDSRIDWSTLGRPGETLVLAVEPPDIEDLIARLIAHGRPSTTPATVVSGPTNGTRPAIRTTLNDLGAVIRAQSLRPPVVVVVGATPSAEASDRAYVTPAATPRRPAVGAL